MNRTTDFFLDNIIYFCLNIYFCHDTTLQMKRYLIISYEQTFKKILILISKNWCKLFTKLEILHESQIKDKINSICFQHNVYSLRKNNIAKYNQGLCPTNLLT